MFTKKTLYVVVANNNPLIVSEHFGLVQTFYSRLKDKLVEDMECEAVGLAIYEVPTLESELETAILVDVMMTNRLRLAPLFEPPTDRG